MTSGSPLYGSSGHQTTNLNSDISFAESRWHEQRKSFLIHMRASAIVAPVMVPLAVASVDYQWGLAFVTQFQMCIYSNKMPLLVTIPAPQTNTGRLSD